MPASGGERAGIMTDTLQCRGQAPMSEGYQPPNANSAGSSRPRSTVRSCMREEGTPKSEYLNSQFCRWPQLCLPRGLAVMAFPLCRPRLTLCVPVLCGL